MNRKNQRRKELNLDEWEDWTDNDDQPLPGSRGKHTTDKPDGGSHQGGYRGLLESSVFGKLNIHLIFCLLVVVIVAVIAIKLFLWNKGTASDYDPDNLSTEFDRDVLDVVFPILPSALKGREDDGVQTILCLGNDPFADDRDASDSLASMLTHDLSKKLDCEVVVYNGSFAGTTVSNEDPYITDDTLHDMFNLYWIVTSLCQQDFTFQKNALMKVEGDGHYAETVDMLENLDMDKIDTLVIFYDAIDYQLARHVTDPSFEMNTGTYIGAMSSSLKMFKEAYPYVRIILLSPTFIQFVDEDGVPQSGDTWDVSNGSLPNYLLHLIDTAQDYGASILDNYYGSITVDNYEEYLDGPSHLNKKGRKLIAQRLVEILP